MKFKFKKNNSKQGQVWVSAIIYTMVAVLALVLILNSGVPLLNELKDRAVFEKVKSIMLDLDSQITDIASQGEGSQSTVSFEVRDGELKFENSRLVWELETKSEILTPRTSTVLGNLIIASNANVNTYETATHYVMYTTITNDTFMVAVNKTGDIENWVAIDSTKLLENVSFNGDNMDGVFTFNLNNNISSQTGNGYVKMSPSGNHSNLGRATITAHMNTSFAEYDLEFTLESYADFVTVNVKNIKTK